MKRPGVYIISYWNKGKPFKGLHTVAVSYDGTNYRAYNLSGNGTVANSLPSCDNRYICGYYLFGNT